MTQDGGLNPAPLNAPPGAPLGIGVQPGSSGLVVAQRVVIFGGAGSGLFVYKPAPGTGNLVASIAGQSGTDPYGNPYLTLLTLVSDTADQIKLLTGRPSSVEAHNAFIGTFSQNVGAGNEILGTVINGSSTVGHLDQVAVELFSEALDGSTPANGFLYWVDTFLGGSHSALQWNKAGITAIGSVSAQAPGVASPPTAETAHVFTPVAGFAQGSPTPRYKLMPDNTVRLSGIVTLTANQPANTLFFTLPAAYAPARAQTLVCGSGLSGTTAGASDLGIATGGGMFINQAGSTGNSIFLDGVTYELD